MIISTYFNASVLLLGVWESMSLTFGRSHLWERKIKTNFFFLQYLLNSFIRYD